jgi:LDH2 family malate/lactate/ureidoglycolate dehydrogenase
MRADICQPLSVFEERLQQMTDEVRLEPNLDGERVLLANDPQIEEAQRRKVEGIPVGDSLLEEFRTLASDLSVDVTL